MKIESVPIDSIHVDPANIRRHPDRNMTAIQASLARFGQQKPVVVDGKGIVRAGNGTLEAARALGWHEINIVRTELVGSEATAYAISDNRTSDLSSFDDTALAETLRALQSEDYPIEAAGWTDDEVDGLLERLASEAGGTNGTGRAVEDPGPQVDRAAELQAKWGTAPGQLWVVPSEAMPGREHRLLCGDSTRAEDVARLMGDDRLRMVWTDPPYGVAYASKNEFLNAVARGNHIQTPIENDHLSEDDTGRVARDALALACEHGLPGAACYVASPPGTLLPFMIQAVKDSGFSYRWQLVWLKNHFVLGRSDYHFRHENILYGWKDGPHYFVDDHTRTSVFEHDKPHQSDLHPTTKPVGLVAEMIENSSRPGDAVYDCFLGSGTTLVACEQTGRVGYGCELTPGYAAVALERLSGLGLEPRLSD